MRIQENPIDIQGKIEALQKDAETARKVGLVAVDVSIAGTLLAGLFFPPVAFVIGCSATALAGGMFIKTIKDEQMIAALKRNQS